MNLLFLYGPPATGKLTVAQELSKITGYPVFHNHLTRDLVHSIYPTNLTEHYALVDKLREDIFTYCAINNTNLIFTFVYDGPQDDETVAKKINVVRQKGGTVLFVELTAPHHILLERVANDSRKNHKKLTNPELLSSLLEANPYSSVPYENILKIDTSIHAPEQSAQLISSYFKLI